MDRAAPPSGEMPLALLEERLGYAFASPELLRLALTHSSASAENFERFEFLGDAALGYAVARLLFDARPGASEHELTLARSQMVSTEPLADLAKRLDVGAFLRLSPGERAAGGAARPSMLADALEAVLGAIACDAGMDAVLDVVRHLVGEGFAAAPGGADPRDPKTRLQERLQAKRLALPRYAVIEIAGKPHAPTFAVTCSAEGVRETGRGPSRRAAEKAAAEAVLRRLTEP